MKRLPERTKDQGPLTADQGLRTKDQGPLTVDQGQRTRDRGPLTADQGLVSVFRFQYFSISVFQRFTVCFQFSVFRYLRVSAFHRLFSAFSVSVLQRFSVSPSGFLVSAFCFLLLNASSAQPKFADLPASLLPATNAVPATPLLTSNAPPSATSAVSQTATNLLAAASTNSMDSLDDKHKLAIGDKLSFRIQEDLDDPREPLEPKPLFVTDSGDIEIPYIGRIPAENKTCQQLARELKAALEKEYYYQATVVLAVDFMTKSRGRVYLVGPVRVPGPQEIPSDEVLTLSKAILRAGGFNDYADRRNVKVTRKTSAADGEKKTFSVDVGDIFDKGRTELDLALEPGDLILVPERLIRF
jgi:polysaccharide biosynthesis/export protein